MSEQFPLMVVAPSFNFERSEKIQHLEKILVSSQLRSLYSGKITIVNHYGFPLFKIERKSVDEHFVPITKAENFGVETQAINRESLFGLCELVNPDACQWVVVARAASLALRNTDHLIPRDTEGTFSPPEVDFYWARAGQEAICNQLATPGLWAVRGEQLPVVLDLLKEEWSKESGMEAGDEEAVWTRVVHQLPLRKRAFEKGEVVAPRIGAVDWEAVSNAAFVTVPDWPKKEAWKFLQALYFGTYLGDETGMILNTMEP